MVPLSGVVLDAPDPRALAEFYRRLLGWEIVQSGDEWVSLRGPEGSSKLSFQREPNHTAPAWPSEPGQQQMQLHLDFQVEDLQAAEQQAVEAGATTMSWQPQRDGVRVMADPAGHVFCLFLPGF
ncbi:VOC family protein [Kribbella sp. NPDC051770]|uniref:VOC family protein n=1 Tax=Kribbella sp. NPDC051770 TaxID=3155413 RepID=UPI00341F731C